MAKTNFVFVGWNTDENGTGTPYSPEYTFTINANVTLYAQWTPVQTTPPPSAPTLLSGVGGNKTAYILFTQTGTVTNYEYSTDNGVTFLAFDPPQIYSPVEIPVLSDGTTSLINGTTYTVILKAVNSGTPSNESNSITVTPTVTSLLTTNRIIYLDANKSSSYSGSGTTWTNLDSGGAYSATLNGAPTFNNNFGNKYFGFNSGAATGQYALITQDASINPVKDEPFTIQMWARINNVGTQGTLISKVFGSPSYDGYAFGYGADASVRLHENGASAVNYFNSPAGVLNNGWALYTANIQFGNGGGRTNKLFVNGRQVVSETSNESGIPSPTQNITFPTGFYEEGECDIGQFYYYNTELTQAQIIQNFDATKLTYL